MIFNPVVVSGSGSIETVIYQVAFNPDDTIPVYHYLDENMQYTSLSGTGVIQAVKNSILWMELNYGRMDNQIPPNSHTGLTVIKELFDSGGLTGDIMAGFLYRCDSHGTID